MHKIKKPEGEEFMFRDFRKGQFLIEISIIVAIVCIAALVFLVPFGKNVVTQINNSVPQKNTAIALNVDLVALLGSESSKFSSIFLNLQQNSNIEAINLAGSITNIVNDAENIRTGKGDTVSDQNFNAILTELKKNSSNTLETSGSLANIIAMNASNAKIINPGIKDSANNIEEILAKKLIKLDISDNNLVDLSNSTVNLLKKQITDGVLSADILAYAGSPVTKEQIAANSVDELFNKNFTVNPNSRKPVDNFINTITLFQKISENYVLPSDLIQKYQDLVSETKKTLKLS